MELTLELHEFIRALEDNQHETLKVNRDVFNTCYQDFIIETWNKLSEWRESLIQKGLKGEHSLLTMKILQYVGIDIHIIAINLISGLYIISGLYTFFA